MSASTSDFERAREAPVELPTVGLVRDARHRYRWNGGPGIRA